MNYVLSINPSPADVLGGYTFFSLPLPRGRFHGAVEGVLADQNVELWPLAYWPEGSLRMVQGLISPKGNHAILQVRESSQNTSPEEEVLSSSFQFGGHQFDWIASSRMYRMAYAGMVYFDPVHFAQVFSTQDGEKITCSVESERGLRIVRRQKHWMRFSTLLCGKRKDGNQSFRFRLCMDVFDHIPGCVLSLMAIHDQPGLDAWTFRSIQTEISLPSASSPVLHGVYQRRYGFEQTESRCVETKNFLDIRAPHDAFTVKVANFEALEDAYDYPPHLTSSDTVSPVFWLNNGTRRLIMEVENFHCLRPKGVFLSDDKALIGIWPEWAEPLVWRQGRRRQIRLALSVAGADSSTDIRVFQAHTAALLDTQRVQIEAEKYQQSQFFDMPWLPPYRADRNPRLEGWLAQISDIKTIPDFFDFGDTPDTHYSHTYYPLGRVPLKENHAFSLPRLLVTSGRNAIAMGNMDARESVFVNNEYDVMHCLASEYLRSGNRVLFQQLCWFARHTMEVDFICYSDFESLHRAQGAHSVGHTSGGAYPSHFWTQGLAEYYFLTGDEDALEIITALAEKTIWYFEHPRLGKLGSGINREMGWAVLTLVSAYEATLKKEFLQYARCLIDTVLKDPLPDDLPILSFGHTSLLLGCKAYMEILAHSEETIPVRDWYLDVVRLAIRSAVRGPEENHPGSSGHPKLSYDYELLDKGSMAKTRPRSGILDGYAALACLSYAWHLSGDRGFIEAGLRSIRAFFDDAPGYWKSIHFRNPIPEGKPFAMAYRTMAEFFHAMDACGLLEEFEWR